MSYEHPRRSRRISKELSILLIGSDVDGKGFSEMTKTVVLSRHGAGVVSKFKLGAEQEIILRYLDTNKESVIRVVGQIGNQSDLYTYGVAFLDDNINFWEMDFPSASESEKRARRVLLECGSCKQRETVDQSETESDVLMVNEGIVRFCKNCGDSTFWNRIPPATEDQPAPPALEQKSEPRQTPAPSVFANATPSPSPTPASGATELVPFTPLPAPTPETNTEPFPSLTSALSAAAEPPSPALEQKPEYSPLPATVSTLAESEPVPLPLPTPPAPAKEPEPKPASNAAFETPLPPPPPAPASEQMPELAASPTPTPSAAGLEPLSPPPPPPVTAAPQPKPKPEYANRRKHNRMRVTYKACIRRPGFPDDVVACEDMSRGGICFKSRKRYYEMTSVDVAVPYSPNDQAIFMPAHIVWVQELSDEKLYKCGVVYRLSAKTF